MRHLPSWMRETTGVAIRLILSAAFAALLTGGVFLALPAELTVHTDIVGYPTFANFNIDRYLRVYGLTVVVFPLATLGAYVVLTRLLVGRPRPRGPIPRPVDEIEPVPVPRGRKRALVAAARTTLVGAVLALEAAIVASEPRRMIVLVAVLAVHAAGVGLAAWLASRLRGADAFGVASAVNTLAAPVAVAGLYAVSEATDVTVSATDAVHEYPWLPWWLAFGLAGAALVWVGTRLRRAADAAAKSALERRALLLVVAPVGLFLLVANLPGAIEPTFDFFEEGQYVAGAELTREGAFPWRDILFAHGLLVDSWYPLLGMEVFEDSRWGAAAGRSMLVEPVVLVAFYYLCAHLFRSNWLYLLGSQALVLSGHVFASHLRFILVPVALLVLAALLKRPSAGLAIVFATLLAVQVVLTPEALPAVVAFGGALALFELYYYERGTGLHRGFRRTWQSLAALAVLALAFAVLLLAYGALDDFVWSYRAFVPGHRYTGGIPFRVDGAWFEVVAPVVLVLAAFGFFVVSTRLRRPLAFRDWTMLAAAALTLLYYTKFLSRADLHVFQSFSVAAPLLLYAGYRAITAAEALLARGARAAGASWFPARHTLTVPILVVLLQLAPRPPLELLRDVPGQFSVAVEHEPEIELVGYAAPGALDATTIREVGRALEPLLGPGDELFDFTNAPGLFHYLLDHPTGTRYYHVNPVMRQRTQSDLIEQLERTRPEVVVFTSDGDGRTLYFWDGLGNQVRHYDVSAYLLDRYEPVLNVEGYVLGRRKEDVARARPELHFDSPGCDWGHVPNFFAPTPDPSAESRRLPFRAAEPVLRVRGWAIDPEGGAPFAEVVATVDGRVVARTARRHARSDIADYLGDPRYRESGFGFAVPAPARLRGPGAAVTGIRVYAVSASGDATELPVPGGGGEALTRIELPGGRSIRVVPATRETGYVDAATVERPYAVTLPADGSARSSRWLEVRTGAPLAEGRFELVDRLDEGLHSARSIEFAPLDRDATSIRVLVGACGQWRGYRSRVLYLTSTVPQDVREIRLLSH